MSLAEYLYVDERRLNSYVEQIGGSLKYDKIPILSADVGLVPKATLQQSRVQRSMSTHEKVSKLKRYLMGKSLLHGPLFLVEEIGREVRIQGSALQPGNEETVILWWLERVPELGGKGLLALLDFTGPDVASAERMSRFSTFAWLVESAFPSLEEERLRPNSAFSKLDRLSPEDFFARAQARIGDPRPVSVLFRARFDTSRYLYGYCIVVEDAAIAG